MSAESVIFPESVDMSDLHSRIGADNLLHAVTDNEQPWEPAPASSPMETPVSGADPTPCSSGLTIKSLDAILSTENDDSDIILDERLLAHGQSCVIAGASGLGKSRLALQMACALACGGNFLNFTNHAEPLKVLMLQTENSERRLKMDLHRLNAHYHLEWETIRGNLRVLTPKTDADYLLGLDDRENIRRIGDEVERENPDVLFLDPLNMFAAGDLNADSDMRETCLAISEIGRRGNSQRAIVVLHHALTGRAGAAKATGFDRSSFGRNSKVLHGWTRAQINLAPGDGDSNDRLVVSCGKNSNGREFAPFGAYLDSTTMIYRLDPDFDLQAWKADVAGKSNAGPRFSTAEIVEILGTGRLTKPDLVKALISETGCKKTAAYNLINKAQKDKLISRCEADKCYGVT